MRGIFAAGMLLSMAATPALAQRLDTRRVDIETVTKGKEKGTSCHFAAVPGLTLFKGPGKKDIASAVWRPASIEDPQATLRLPFRLGRNGGREFRFGNLALFYKPEGDSTPPSMDSATVVLDGSPRPGLNWLTMDDQETRTIAAVFMGTDDIMNATGNAVMQSRSMTIELGSKAAGTRTSYSFDTSRLRDVAELLELVHWDCLSPDP